MNSAPMENGKSCGPLPEDPRQGEHAVGLSPRLGAKACRLSAPQEAALWASPAYGD